ncbi:MAG: hypothetical protein GYB68_05365 [Chloroflexi bacterium]|nr:hypothetical protein [Chloroflexota bacterium]
MSDQKESPGLGRSPTRRHDGDEPMLHGALYASMSLDQLLKRMDDRQRRLFACLCAEHVLYYFERDYPEDRRPRQAIETARRFAHNQTTGEQLALAQKAAEQTYEEIVYQPRRETAAAAARAAASAALNPVNTRRVITWVVGTLAQDVAVSQARISRAQRNDPLRQRVAWEAVTAREIALARKIERNWMREQAIKVLTEEPA